jgi:UDP-N-acetylglucosamine 4-epimerase
LEKRIDKILVTGGAGFIGSSLCERLLSEGKEVICIDNLSTGSLENISDFFHHPHFQFVQKDIRDYESCLEHFSGIDLVFHQAALGSVPRSIDNPLNTNSVNIDGFLNVIYSSLRHGVSKVIFAASSSTYGDSLKLPKVESEIGRPLSPYAVTKLVNELYADVFARTYGMKLIGLRYFNVFGRRQDPNGAYAAVIPKFIHQLMIEESPVINGDGLNSRDFTYIDNVIDANLLAMNAPDSAFNQIYNVACGEQTNLKEMVELMKRKLAKYNSKISDVEIVYGPSRKGDIPHSLASIEKAQKMLNYHPRFKFQEGLSLTVDWYWNQKK